MIENRKIILGAGISGLAAAYSLKKIGIIPIILEKDETYGGLCGNFEINGFRFDRFVHLSFTKDEEVKRIFRLSSPEVIKHIPNPYNIYKGKWVKHPAQNNLFPLSENEKKLIINDFLNRPNPEMTRIENYEDWLRIQFGNYFAENFPMVYTKKYWMTEAKNLRTEWVGDRLYQPSIDEVINGSQSNETPVTFYAKEMLYPKQGGYKQFIFEMAKDANIQFNKKVVFIDVLNKTIQTTDNIEYKYDELISSIPLPELINCINEVPQDVRTAASGLQCTSGYQVSIGLKTKNIPPYLWWYIYDEEILPARVYSPSLKSPDNVPEGCSSLQLEIYCKQNEYTNEEIIERSIGKLIELDLIKKDDILFTDIRFENYANVIFDKDIYINRKIVRDYLTSQKIRTIGRFGEWDYLWSDQSLLSGLNYNK